MSWEEIERAAIRLFSEKSYLEVGIRDISKAAGLPPGSVYVHVKSKNALLLAIVERGVLNYLRALTPIVESNDSAASRLRRSVLAYMMTLDSNLELTKVSMFQWIHLAEPGRKRIAELHARFRWLFSIILTDGISSGEFSPVGHRNVVVLNITGMLYSTINWYDLNGSASPREISEQITNLILKGLAG